METRWLQDFLAVAETGNFTRAAAARGASQAAFSRRIQALEAWLGATLIDRSAFPTRLTPEGERFREGAGEILRQVLDARASLAGGRPSRRDHVRLALPYALATSSLPGWWGAWAGAGDLSCETVLGNVHDIVTALVSGDADLLICFHHPQQPVHLDEGRYVRAVLGVERLRPYAAPSSGLALPGGPGRPGRGARPTPLLMYSRGIYLARMVGLILEGAPATLDGFPVMESDMADVLRDLAVDGAGIAWLPEATARRAPPGALEPLGDGRWELPLSVVAFRDREAGPALAKLWSRLEKGSGAAAPAAPPRSMFNPAPGPGRPAQQARPHAAS